MKPAIYERNIVNIVNWRCFLDKCGIKCRVGRSLFGVRTLKDFSFSTPQARGAYHLEISPEAASSHKGTAPEAPWGCDDLTMLLKNAVFYRSNSQSRPSCIWRCDEVRLAMLLKLSPLDEQIRSLLRGV